MILDASVLGRTLRVEVRGRDGSYTVSLDGKPFEVRVSHAAHGFSHLRIGGRGYEVGLEREAGGYRVVIDGANLLVELAEATRGGTPSVRHEHGPARLTAPMPGRIVRVLVPLGSQVAAGQGLVVIEAMKMENELRAPRAGCLQELRVSEGQAVEAGTLLAVLA